MSARPIRVLHVLGSMNPGGVESWLMTVLRNLDRGKYKMDFCTFGTQPGSYGAEIEELGSRIVPCPMRRNLIAQARDFRGLLLRGQYDVVHSHVLFFSGAVLRWARSVVPLVRVAHAHSSSDGRITTLARRGYRRWMKRWVQRYATHGLAASRLAATTLFGARWESDARFRVLHYGLQLGAFEQQINPDVVRSELGIPAGAPVIGHVGRFVEPKNHRFVVEVFSRACAARKDLHLLLVGDGPLRAEIQEQCRKLGLADNVHFAGLRQDVPRLMLGAMNVFVFPSLWEGLGLAAVESQAAGLRGLLSDVVPREVEAVPGLLEFASLSTGADDWAKRLLSNFCEPPPDQRECLRKVRHSDFSVEQCLNHLSEFYCKAVLEAKSRA